MAMKDSGTEKASKSKKITRSIIRKISVGTQLEQEELEQFGQNIQGAELGSALSNSKDILSAIASKTVAERKKYNEMKDILFAFFQAKTQEELMQHKDKVLEIINEVSKFSTLPPILDAVIEAQIESLQAASEPKSTEPAQPAQPPVPPATGGGPAGKFSDLPPIGGGVVPTPTPTPTPAKASASKLVSAGAAVARKTGKIPTFPPGMFGGSVPIPEHLKQNLKTSGASIASHLTSAAASVAGAAAAAAAQNVQDPKAALTAGFTAAQAAAQERARDIAAQAKQTFLANSPAIVAKALESIQDIKGLQSFLQEKVIAHADAIGGAALKLLSEGQGPDEILKVLANDASQKLLAKIEMEKDTTTANVVSAIKYTLTQEAFTPSSSATATPGPNPNLLSIIKMAAESGEQPLTLSGGSLQEVLEICKTAASAKPQVQVNVNTMDDNIKQQVEALGTQLKTKFLPTLDIDAHAKSPNHFRP